MDKKQQILDFITNELATDTETDITETTSLFQDRVLDSLSLITIIAFLEDTFNIKIGTSEISIDNFDNIENMAELVDKKLST